MLNNNKSRMQDLMYVVFVNYVKILPMNPGGTVS